MSRHLATATLGALVCLVVSSPAGAQERLELFTFLNGQSRIVELDATVRGFGAVTATTPVPNGLAPSSASLGSPGELVPIAGGRYIAWTNLRGTSGPLLAFDRRSRTILDASSLLPSGVADISIIESDTHRPRLFIAGRSFSHSELWAIDLHGAPPVRLAVSELPFTDAAYAAATNELFYLEGDFEGNARSTWVVAANATTGQELRRWMMPGFVTAIRVNAGGHVVWVDHGGLKALDATTGAVLAASDQFSAAFATFDEQRGVLVVRQGDFLVAVDPWRLTELGRARIAFTPPDPVIDRTAQTLPGRWMTGAYTVRVESRETFIGGGRTGRDDRYEFTCNALYIDALDTNGARRESADLLARLGPGGSAVGSRDQGLRCRALAVLVRSPFAPSALAASVSGSVVSLAWQDPGDTTEFEVAFGFAQGQRAGAVRVGRATAIDIPGVPPGVYYVRVTAVNEVGPSPASNEVRVVVR